MNIKKFIQEYPGVIDAEVCDVMVDWFENEAETFDSSVEIPPIPNGPPRDKFGRKSFSALINDERIDKFMFEAVEIALARYRGLEINPLQWYPVVSKGYHISKYRKNDGMWKEHCDDAHEQLRDRVLTVKMFLNDAEDGDLVFTQTCKDITPKKGTVLVFPSNWMFGYEIKTSDQDRWIATASVCLENQSITAKEQKE